MGIGGVLLRRLAGTAFLPGAWLQSRFHGGIRILMYHRVSPTPVYDQLTVTPERFARQMEYLRRHCRILGLAQAVDELRSSEFVRSGIVVTFDDGYRDNLEFALPILRRFEIPATIFVTTAFCDQTARHPRYPDSPERLHLDWHEVRELANAPGICIGSHTLTHPYLSRTTDAQASAEICSSKDRLASEVQGPVDYFCYPSGDVTEREQQMVQSAGYRAAVTVAPGVNSCGVALHALRRTEITDRDGVVDLFMKVKGAYDPIHRLLHWRRRRNFAKAAAAAHLGVASGANK